MECHSFIRKTDAPQTCSCMLCKRNDGKERRRVYEVWARWSPYVFSILLVTSWCKSVKSRDTILVFTKAFDYLGLSLQYFRPLIKLRHSCQRQSSIDTEIKYVMPWIIMLRNTWKRMRVLRAENLTFVQWSMLSAWFMLFGTSSWFSQTVSSRFNFSGTKLARSSGSAWFRCLLNAQLTCFLFLCNLLWHLEQTCALEVLLSLRGYDLVFVVQRDL